MITATRMAAVDRNAAALGVSQRQLMESAGNAVARLVREVTEPGAAVVVLAGRGNNGGDALVAARYLDDFDVSVRLLGRPSSITTSAARANWEALTAADYDVHPVVDSTGLSLGDPDVVVDGLLGTGVSGPTREPERSAIEAINGTAATVVSVDVPSGLDADTGEGELVVAADHVVTFHDVKPGISDRSDVRVAHIGIPPAAERFVGPGDLLSLTRPTESHKGDAGRVLIIGGGPYTGAPSLAARAALRAGADLAYVAAPETVSGEIQGYAEDLIVEPFGGGRLTTDQIPGLLDRSADVDVVVVGPGLGEAADSRAAVAEFLGGFDGTAVVDADALAAVPDVDTGATLVCTPHQGELREMGGPVAEDWRERAEAVEAFAAELGHVLLVKGAVDVVSDGETTRVSRTGNPGMTVGGTGDVLAGAAGALLAVAEPVDAAAVAAYANGRAGDLLAEERGYGLVASDLPDRLPVALWGER